MTQFINGCGCNNGAQLVAIQETEERPYLYDVGGEQKETINFTKELRQWLQSFIAIGGRCLDTLAEMRQLTQHYAGQVMVCFENEGVYQYQLVTTEDDGENSIMPDNVYAENTGRWILKAKLTATAYNMWSILKYTSSANESTTYYVDAVNGTDSETKDGTVDNPFKTVQYAIDTYVYVHGYWKGTLTIKLKCDYAPPLTIQGLIGNGSLVIQSDSAIVRVISAGDVFSILNNQVRIGLSAIESTSMTIQSSDVSFTYVTTGDGTATNSKLNIGTDSIFGLDCDYCDIVTFEGQINSTINHSNLIAGDLQGGSAISVLNSIIASNNYEFITTGDNCTSNEPKITTPLTEYIGFTTPNITVKGYVLPCDEAIIERGLVYANATNPTTDDTKIVNTEIGSGVFSKTFLRFGASDTTYVKSYIITSSGTYYGNEVSYDSSNE